MSRKKIIKLSIKIFVIVCLITAVTIFVYQTGGIKYVYSHTMYLAILLSGYFFGLYGGIASAVVGGILLGPWMPVVVSTGEMQSTLNWIYRLTWFLVIGGIWGAIVDSLRAKVHKIEWANMHHPVTGLKTIAALEKEFHKYTEANKVGEKICVVICSIQNLDTLVSTFGHKAGELIMVQFRDRVQQQCRLEVHIFQQRMGRFIIIVPSLSGTAEAEIANNIQNTSKECFWIADIPVHLELSIGISTSVKREENENAIDLVRRAIIAQEKAAQLERPYLAYIPQMDQKLEESIALIGQLPKAIENNELYLEYQGKLNINEHKLLGAEALIRWNHPVLGRVSPGAFIPHAEASDLINPLTDWVIDTALMQLQEWIKQGFYIKLAINVSIRNLQDNNFIDRLMKKLSKYGTSSDSIELEVTEWSLMKDQIHIIDTLKKLAEIPIALSIDDFGTGYSSLQYLNKLPANTIKIDREFIKGIEKDIGLYQIVRAATKIGHALNMNVVAEGVETDQQYNMVKKAQCDAVQGYYLHRPSSAEDLVKKFGTIV